MINRNQLSSDIDRGNLGNIKRRNKRSDADGTACNHGALFNEPQLEGVAQEVEDTIGVIAAYLTFVALCIYLA